MKRRARPVSDREADSEVGTMETHARPDGPSLDGAHDLPEKGADPSPGGGKAYRAPV